MNGARHIVFINEFFHPDICASAVVAADHLPKIARLRPRDRITVITGNRAWNDPSIVYAAEDDYEDVRIVRVERPVVNRTNLLRRALGFAAFQHGALRAARQLDRVDLLIATTAPPQGGGIARKIARRRNCPYIYKVLDLYPDLGVTLGRVSEGSFLHRRWLAADTSAMQEAAHVVGIGRRLVDRIAGTRAVPADRLTVIHDGFDSARLRTGRRPEAGDSPNAFRHQHNPEGRFVIQYAGNMGLSHPFEAILMACGELADDEVLFQFIGDGPQRGRVEDRLPRNGQIMDYQPAHRLGEVLATADLCLISQHEDMFDKALPYKVYAILAAGKPSIFIGSERSEIAGWLTKHEAGICVRQADASALAESIRSMKRDPARLRCMGESARRLFDTSFCSESAAEKWAALIDRVLL